jgi:hypothetical protein
MPFASTGDHKTCFFSRAVSFICAATLLRTLLLLAALLMRGVSFGQSARGAVTGYLITLYTTGYHHNVYKQLVISEAAFANAQAVDQKGRTHYLSLLRQEVGSLEVFSCCELGKPYKPWDSLGVRAPSHQATYAALADSNCVRYRYCLLDERDTPAFTLRLNGDKYQGYVHQFRATVCPCWATLGYESRQIGREWKNTGRVLGQRFVVLKQVQAYQPASRTATKALKIKRLLKQQFNILLQANTFPLQ